MESKSKSLLIIIPAFNESKIISKTISKVIAEINDLKLKTNLLIVDDGSSDETADIVLNLKKKNPNKIKLLKHSKNKGYGQAVQTGIKYGINNKFTYALFMDCDLTNDPKDIKKFVDQIKYNFDCIKASRYIEYGGMLNIPKKRIIFSRIGNLIASVLFKVGVKDCTNGFLMIKLKIFNKVRLKEKGFAVIMEEMYYLKMNKATFKEIPVILINRKTGSSSFKYSISTFYNYIKYPIKSLWL